MAVFFLIVLIVLILLFSGLVSGSEAALLSLTYPKAKELVKKSKNKKRAQVLVYVKENIRKYITTIVILNNIINIVGSIYVGILATRIFEGNELLIGIISALMTFLIIIFAEIIPKMYGERYSSKISLWVVKPLVFIGKILTPLVFVFDKIALCFVKDSKKKNVSEGEIREMAILGAQEGSINGYENKVISKVFEMNDIEVYDIMIPKSKVVMVNVNSTYDEILLLASTTGFTRFPIIREDGEIIGLVNAKDLFRYYDKKDKFNVFKVMRPIIYASDYMKIYTLEAKFKKERSHMAIVINEHGDYIGIVTLEDVIEELLGDIEDEFDTKEKLIKRVSDSVYHIKGEEDIEFINQKFNLGLDVVNRDFTTLNGFLIVQLGKIPKINDKLNFNHFKLRVLKANRKRVLEAELVLKTNF